MQQNYRILRGRNQIGGTITEISSETTRLWVDLGAELPGGDASERTDSEMLARIQDDSPDAVLFTHIHGDHMGLLHGIPEQVQHIFMGPVARKLLINIRKTLLKVEELPEEERERLQRELTLLMDDDRIVEFVEGQPFIIGDIQVTAYPVDHSVCDAYMLRFMVEGKTILHTGDFRNHGRMGKGLLKQIDKMVDVPVDILITEGTMMSRGAEQMLTEEELQMQATALMKKHKYAFLICSSTNMESLASFYWATVFGAESGKKPPFMVNSYVKQQLDLFTKEIGEKKQLKAFTFYRSYEIQQKLQKRLKNGKTQKQHMIDEGFMMLVGTGTYYQALMEEFRRYNPIVIYSMWGGYLDADKPYANGELIGLVDKWRENVVCLHTSGHAGVKTLEAVIKAVNPREAIVPVHTEYAGGFLTLDLPEELKHRVILEE